MGHSLSMRAAQLLLGLGLLLTASSSPQGAREKFKEHLQKISPCGEGVKPACKPKDWESCTCPGGETVDVDLEKDFKAFKQEMRKELILSKSPCGAGIEPTGCTCEDGSTVTLDFTPGTKPCDGALDFCSCPNGETFDKQQIKEIVKSLKAERGKN